MSVWNAIGIFGFLWIGVALSGAYQAQRLLSSKDAKNASFAQLLHTIVYYAMMAWPWILVALCSMILLPDLGVGVWQICSVVGGRAPPQSSVHRNVAAAGVRVFDLGE